MFFFTHLYINIKLGYNKPQYKKNAKMSPWFCSIYNKKPLVQHPLYNWKVTNYTVKLYTIISCHRQALNWHYANQDTTMKTQLKKLCSCNVYKEFRRPTIKKNCVVYNELILNQKIIKQLAY